MNTIPITGAVVVAIPLSGKPFVSCEGAIFEDVKAATAAAIETILADDSASVTYAVATIGVTDKRQAST